MAGKENKATSGSDAQESQQIKVNWDTSSMNTAYANVANVSSTREEVTLLFGTNQSFDADQKQVTVQLSDRIILNPFAAKRLMMVLKNVVEGYESRFGSLPLEAPAAPPASNSQN